MYKLAVNQDFMSRHFLIGGNWGAENQVHSHKYRIEVQLKGDDLDSHGYLVDIVKVREHLEGLVARYRGRTLNELPEFEGMNPSIENLARISYQVLRRPFLEIGMPDLEVNIWEDDVARATYQEG